VCRVVVNCVCVCQKCCAFWDDVVFESDVVVCVVFDAPGRYWTETKDFFDTSVDIGEVGHVVKPWGAGVSDDTA
jgi:hypothetical protein